MSFDGNAVIDAGGRAVVTLKNDSTTRNYVIENLTISVANETLDGTCRLYRDSISPDNLLTTSGIGRADQADGPYSIRPGGILICEFDGLTPGNVAVVTTSRYQSDVLIQGRLRFQNPPTVDIGTIKVEVTNWGGNSVMVQAINDAPIPPSGSQLFAIFGNLPTGTLWQLRYLAFYASQITGLVGTHSFVAYMGGKPGTFNMPDSLLEIIRISKSSLTTIEFTTAPFPTNNPLTSMFWEGGGGSLQPRFRYTNNAQSGNQTNIELLAYLREVR